MNLVPIHLLILLIFLNRYIAGLWLRRLRGRHFDDRVEGYEPTVAIAVPMFNEGQRICRTIDSLLRLDYPVEKLEVWIVDDCSTDDSFHWARQAAAGHPHIRVLRNPANLGKRRSINQVVQESTAELIISVDSDVEVDPQAVRHLVARFSRADIAAVGGRVHVTNAHQNWLTRMQAVKYHLSYEYIKAIEQAFQSVLCLSGCLTAYRRQVLLQLQPVLENRQVLGVPIKYGEDRFLTRQILKAGYRTVLTLEATCRTRVPATLSQYFSQQLRWRRSNAIDFLGGLSHIWRLHPVVALHYASLFALLLSYPVLILESLLVGSFLPLASFHLLVVGALGVIYRLDTRKAPPGTRVGALSLLPMSILMPVTYLLYTPLALFTLDSGSWETRGHTPTPASATNRLPHSPLAEATA